MPVTYTMIASQTFTATASIISFTSIPGTYTDLVLMGDFARDNASNINTFIYLNNDSSQNYVVQYLGAAGGIVNAFPEFRNDIGSNNASASYVGVRGQFVVNFFNYASTAYKKTALTHIGSPLESYLEVGTWLSTSAVTTVTISTKSVAVWNTGTNFSLYGILRA